MERNDADTPNPGAQTPGSLTFEAAAGRVEEIVRLLERGDAPLDTSLTLFEEGAKLLKACGKLLDEAEQIVARVQKGADGEPEQISFADEE